MARKDNDVKPVRKFLMEDGEAQARTGPQCVGVSFTFPSGKELVMMLEDLPQPILRASAGFGINTSVGNAFGGSTDEQDAIEKAEDRWETLKSGEWASERQTGPRNKDVIDAVCRAKEAGGGTADDAFRENLTKLLADGDITTTKLLKNEQVQAQYRAIKAEREAEKAAKAQAAAEGAAAEDLDELLAV